jgi:hypothetical protein
MRFDVVILCGFKYLRCLVKYKDGKLIIEFKMHPKNSEIHNGYMKGTDNIIIFYK